MARVTVEDCITKIENRFELVLLAAQRARNIAAGADLTMDRDNDKNPVVALREIAEETVPFDKLKNSLIRRLQKHVEMDEPEEDEMDVLAIQRELSRDMDVFPSPDDISRGEVELVDDVASVDLAGEVGGEVVPEAVSDDVAESDGDEEVGLAES